MILSRIITVLLIAVIAVFGIHVFNVKTEAARLDFTETKLYSLTQGTQDILSKMKDEGAKPIEVKLYYSLTAGKSLPQFIKKFINHENYVRNLLREYQRASDGKITVKSIDPVPDSDDAEDAADYGLEGKPINQYGDMFYFGMVFETQTGSKDIIEFLWPEKQETTEYEISKKIYNLVWPSKKRIGVLSGLEPLPDTNPYMAQMLAAQGKQPSEPWSIMKLLEESYSVATIDPEGESISKDDYDLVLVIHPRDFGEKTLWNLNEWVVTGGDTLVFLDPYCLMDQAPRNPQQPWAQLQYKPSSNLETLLKGWGLQRMEDQFAVDYELAVRRPVNRQGTVAKVITDLMVTEELAGATLNQDIPVFQGLTSIRFFLAGALETEAVEGVEITPLITTTAAGSTLKIEPGFGERGKLAFTDLDNPNKLLDQYSPSDKKITLACMVSGKLASAYPEGAKFPASSPKPPPGMPPGFQMPPDENAEMIEKEAIPEDQLQASRVMVFADVDFITDQLAFQRSLFGLQAVGDNYKVLINSIDYLLGAKELMNVRSKQRIRRPFKRFDEIEAKADKELLDQEREIRADIERFQEEVREKQRGVGEKNAVLLKKKIMDDIDGLNEKIREGNKKLREIKKAKRAVLEDEETFVWNAIMWAMPLLVCFGGLASYINRRNRARSSRGGRP